MAITWPDGKRFAFTIVDDTDFATLASVRPIYDLLRDLGFRTTKTVWPLRATRDPFTGGDSLEDDDYRAWVQELRDAGFEIALHGVADHGSPRAEVEKGLARFRDVVGQDPRMHINHYGQDENLYWGPDRFDQPFRALYSALQRVRGGGERFHGHEEGSPWFWGDLAKERVTYVRNLTFSRIDTLAADPVMPYHDPRRPWVNWWFSSSDAGTRKRFVRILREGNQDRLARSGSACVLYTHFGANGFVERGRVDPEVARLLERLAALDGWFVPASDLLDHVGAARGWRTLDRRGPFHRLQVKWFAGKLRTREIS
jgi:hypothetical protein